MRTRAMVVLIAVVYVVFAAAYVSAQQPDVKSLAGKWRGYATPTKGGNVTLEVDVKPDGSYTTLYDGKPGKGRIVLEGDKLMSDGLLYGTGSTAPEGKAQLTLTTKDGKQVMSGSGHGNDGAYNFELTKQ